MFSWCDCLRNDKCLQLRPILFPFVTSCSRILILEYTLKLRLSHPKIQTDCDFLDLTAVLIRDALTSSVTCNFYSIYSRLIQLVIELMSRDRRNSNTWYSKTALQSLFISSLCVAILSRTNECRIKTETTVQPCSTTCHWSSFEVNSLCPLR